MRVRDAICELPTSRTAEISALGMGDPEVIPLWYGESDLPTPEFIAAALRAGHTFYTYKAGLPELPAALAPGSAFGPMGEGYLRLRFARDPAAVAEAVERLRPMLD